MLKSKQSNHLIKKHHHVDKINTEKTRFEVNNTIYMHLTITLMDLVNNKKQKSVYIPVVCDSESEGSSLSSFYSSFIEKRSEVSAHTC